MVLLFQTSFGPMLLQVKDPAYYESTGRNALLPNSMFQLAWNVINSNEGQSCTVASIQK